MTTREIIQRLTAIQETGSVSDSFDHVALDLTIIILERLEASRYVQRPEKIAGTPVRGSGQ